MMTLIMDMVNKVLQGEQLTIDEAKALCALDESYNEAIFNGANEIRKHYMGNHMDLCSIMNAKSGSCSEDCRFCAQSGHYKTQVETYGVISVESALKRAKENLEHGIHHFSLVTSGRALSPKDFDQIIACFQAIHHEYPELKLCASLGFITKEQGKTLYAAGVRTYHHNLETSERFYSSICTTHTYEERLETISNARNANLNVCCGCILGLGETMDDRLELAFRLQSLDINSIPINILNPVAGTPLENQALEKPLMALKTMAIFRFILPKAYIRYAGGRKALGEHQSTGLKAGVNAALVGDYLTTIGNSVSQDLELFSAHGMTF